MTEEEAESAKAKPSCLALVIRHSKTERQIGILYADATDNDYFGNKIDAENAVEAFTSSDEFNKIRESFENMHSAMCITSSAIDLNRIENLRS